MPAEEFMTASDESPNTAAHPLAVVSTLLRGKREMTPEAVKALDELVQAAFKISKEFK
jgi:hypothetical protein